MAIGRAIARHPKVFLFDEPLSNLDASLRNQMRLELTDLHARLGSTMIYVTHDQVEAMTMADKIIVLNAGKVEQVGSPMDLYERPATPFVASFIGSPKMNLFEGEFAAGMGCSVYGIRPEHLTITESDGRWAGTLRNIERLGADTILHVDVDCPGATRRPCRWRSPISRRTNDLRHALRRPGVSVRFLGLFSSQFACQQLRGSGKSCSKPKPKGHQANREEILVSGHPA